MFKADAAGNWLLNVARLIGDQTNISCHVVELTALTIDQRDSASPIGLESFVTDRNMYLIPLKAPPRAYTSFQIKQVIYITNVTVFILGPRTNFLEIPNEKTHGRFTRRTAILHLCESTSLRKFRRKRKNATTRRWNTSTNSFVKNFLISKI